MRVNIGDKITAVMPDGLRWPGVVTGNEEVAPTTILNRATNQNVTFDVVRADVITFRSTKEGDAYLKPSTETVQYGYKPTMERRFSTVIGLDASADGEVLGLQDLIDAAAESRSAFLASAFAARKGATAAADL